MCILCMYMNVQGHTVPLCSHVNYLPAKQPSVLTVIHIVLLRAEDRAQATETIRVKLG